jgi:hypothetical protein
MLVRDDQELMGRWRAGACPQLSGLLSGLGLVRVALEREPVAVGPSLRRLGVLAECAGSWLERHPCPQPGASDRYRSLVSGCQLAGARRPPPLGPDPSLDHEVDDLATMVQAFVTSLCLDWRGRS